MIALVAAGCGGSSDSGGTKIALLLPENETPRYETNDKPDFEKAVEEQCTDCEVIYSNAGGDAEKQQSQGEAALTQGAEVIVVDPMDSKSAAAIVEKAHAQDVPVVSYDRLIENGEVDAYVSFDNEKVGELQAETLAKKLKEDGSPNGPIIMINGDPADPNAALFKEGAHNGFEAAGVEIAKEYDTPGWSAENAQSEAQQAITALGNDGFAGIYAANDDTGGGAIAALKGAGINPEENPVTGQDATVAGLQRILAGQQFMTVYKEIAPQAESHRRNRARPRRRRRSAAGQSHRRSQQRQGRSPLGAARTDRGDQRQRQEHGGRGRVRDRVRTLHRRLRGRVQRSGNLGLSMSTGAPLLELEGVSKRFGPVQALDRVDFAVNAGEVVGLVGDNGAGKSTLVKTIAGIHAADEGTIRFEGEEVSITKPQDATALGIATVYQDLALCDNLDVVANLFLGREEVSPGLGDGLAPARRGADGAPDRRAALQPGGDDPQPAQRGRDPLRRPAPAGRGRPLAARRAEGRAARRADRGARRAADRTGAEPDPAPARARASASS